SGEVLLRGGEGVLRIRLPLRGAGAAGARDRGRREEDHEGTATEETGSGTHWTWFSLSGVRSLMGGAQEDQTAEAREALIPSRGHGPCSGPRPMRAPSFFAAVAPLLVALGALACGARNGESKGAQASSDTCHEAPDLVDVE